MEMNSFFKEVHVFEPRQDAVLRLRNHFKHFPSVKVHGIAVSYGNGKNLIRIPKYSAGWSTIEPENKLKSKSKEIIVEYQVDTASLDSFCFENVSLIKIDVEGHENSVLEGARLTIENLRPVVIIEAEDSHRPNATKSVIDFFNSLGYKGCFRLGRELIDIANFNVNIHQKERGEYYCNNFIFYPNKYSDLLCKYQQTLVNLSLA